MVVYGRVHRRRRRHHRVSLVMVLGGAGLEARSHVVGLRPCEHAGARRWLTVARCRTLSRISDLAGATDRAVDMCVHTGPDRRAARDDARVQRPPRPAPFPVHPLLDDRQQSYKDKVRRLH